MDDKQRFVAVFDEWVSENESVLAIISRDLLSAIAGYFYFTGARDGVADARAIVLGKDN